MSAGFTFGSLFSGVGLMDLGLERAGGECLWRVEWDKAAAGVLAHHWQGSPLFADVSKVTGAALLEASRGICPQVIAFGFPCQDVSVAGKRAGLEGKRTGLFYEAARIIRELRELGGGIEFGLAENVPGLLSADDHGAFANCLGELLQLGAREVGWRILDSQYFGVAQRRERVFIVSDFGGERAGEILSFVEGVQGYPSPRQEAGQGVAPTLDARAGRNGANTFNTSGGLVEVANTLTTGSGGGRYDKQPFTISPTVSAKLAKGSGGPAGDECQNLVVAHTLRGEGFDASEDGTGRGTPLVAFNFQQSGDTALGMSISGVPPCRRNAGCSLAATTASGVRRLMPIECERLQGAPDNWTEMRAEVTLDGNQWRGTGKTVRQADGPRYRQLGNAVTVPVAEWIGRGIAGNIGGGEG